MSEMGGGLALPSEITHAQGSIPVLFVTSFY